MIDILLELPDNKAQEALKIITSLARAQIQGSALYASDCVLGMVKVSRHMPQHDLHSLA